MKVTWVVVNCVSVHQADQLGTALLKKRLVSCFDVFPRAKTAYFWPPKSGKIETAKGAMLVLDSLPAKVSAIRKLVKKLHSDTLPFIGSFAMDVESAYYKWMASELKK
jgi:uncharacterized protein involved in tolerance to divalent cations